MSSTKPWDRPWSMDEVISNSDKWNLAGDVALLNTLKAFADNLLSRTTGINNNLQNLTNSLDETSLQLNISQNEFQSLRNSQFIESRVYEDDETLPPVEENKKVEVGNELDRTEDVRLAAVKGLEVLDKYFEKIEVSVSDSEDEDIDLPNFVLRSKDLYIERPLPYVIGSEKWHKSWHVGLGDSSSDSDTEKVSDNFSESDSESDLPVIQDRSQIKGTSDTSSELDLSQKIDRPKDFINSSDSENSVPVSGPPQNFAEQLAAKLGHVIQEPEVNQRTIQKKNHYGNLFFDEPPPLEESTGLFSGGSGLFDDEDPKDSSKSGLFDESDEDVSSPQKPQFLKKKPFVEAPLFDEEPPALEKKKPVGGVSILGGGGLFDKKLLRRQVSSEDEESVKEKKVDLFADDSIGGSAEVKVEGAKKVSLFVEDESLKKKEEKVEKKVSLFEDEDDDLFKNDLFSSKNTKKITGGLFDDIPEDDLFGGGFEKKSKPAGNLFEDLMKILDDKSSINVDTKKEDKENGTSGNKIEEKNAGNDVTDNLFASSPDIDDLFRDVGNRKSESKTEGQPPQPTPHLYLFDSPPPEPEDLFTTPPQQSVKTDLFTSSTPQNIPNMRLFDTSPPPDDEWETKSEHLSENEDSNNDLEEAVENKTILFSDEPPSLDFKVKSGKPGKLKHKLDIDVGALLPGSVRPKRIDGAGPVNDDVTQPTVVSSEVTKVAPEVPKKSPEVTKTKEVTFDDDGVKVLTSVTKDRARVPSLNRRPSTRRGRKAALRNSGSDFKLEQETKEFGENIEQRTEVKIEKQENLFEPQQIENDQSLGLFDDKNDFFDAEPQKSENKNLFGDSRDDLFEAKPQKAENKPSVGLFDQPPDDDFFSSVKKEPRANSSLFEEPPVEDIFEIRPQKSEKVQNLGLFDEPPDILENEPQKSEKTSKMGLFEEPHNKKPQSEKKPSLDLFDEPVSDDLFQVKSRDSDDDLGLFGGSKSEDLFKVKSEEAQKSDLKVKSEKKSDSLFDVSEDNDFLITKPQKVESKASSKPKNDLFGDDDEDDNLFSTKKKSLQPKVKKSLFDDDNDEDDDIFKSFSSAGAKKPETKMAFEKKVPKVSSVKKLENTKPEDDPLSALLK